MMSTGRFSAPGKTRICPHCKATILDSASVCPACNHHLRFDPAAQAEKRAQATSVPLKVEGILRHQEGADPWEYSVVISVRNERGEEIARKVVGVGALDKGEQRTFTLAVEVFKGTGSR